MDKKQEMELLRKFNHPSVDILNIHMRGGEILSLKKENLYREIWVVHATVKEFSDSYLRLDVEFNTQPLERTYFINVDHIVYMELRYKN